ncbi:hypothetical protein CBR_g30141 [Chara braunii]|uniref:Uncharacterized protein n=1 Tax=Chara braunii TaxID=69332 RepID=A0A388LC21_CHABU|nr:hypothetical protein CBR_g30141 [Chara braunii]|eukprot:GBG79875.1 hypothetical protein CBR_g30141 [Chara braunii]
MMTVVTTVIIVLSATAADVLGQLPPANSAAGPAPPPLPPPTMSDSNRSPPATTTGALLGSDLPCYVELLPALCPSKAEATKPCDEMCRDAVQRALACLNVSRSVAADDARSFGDQYFALCQDAADKLPDATGYNFRVPPYPPLPAPGSSNGNDTLAKGSLMGAEDTSAAENPLGSCYRLRHAFSCQLLMLVVIGLVTWSSLTPTDTVRQHPLAGK